MVKVVWRGGEGSVEECGGGEGSVERCGGGKGSVEVVKVVWRW